MVNDLPTRDLPEKDKETKELTWSCPQIIGLYSVYKKKQDRMDEDRQQFSSAGQDGNCMGRCMG
jgi:hypothetical protein